MASVQESVNTRRRPALRAAAGAGLTAAAMSLAFASPAAAGQPNNQACLGHDISGYAQTGAGFGAFVAGLAKGTGAADEIQAHLAGNVPDAVSPNSCND